MTLRPKLARGVRAEIRDAALWYGERDREVGARFVDAVDGAIRRATQRPDIGSPLEGVNTAALIRRLPVGRFPYQLVYTTVDDTLYVLAVAHHRRRPGYWAERVRT